MSGQTMLISCSNAGDCPKAETPTLDSRLPSCPYCGKLLSSPHAVFVEISPDAPEEHTPLSIAVIMKLGGNCVKPESVWLEVNDNPQEPKVTVPASGGPIEIDNLKDGLEGGLYQLRAGMTTSDGRTTWSDERLLFVSRKPVLFAPLVWALLLVLLLCLNTSLNWLGKPLFGAALHPSLSHLVDAVSVVSALLIGGLLLSLGWRESKIASKEQSLVRPTWIKGSTRTDRVLNRMGETASSSSALIILGALPFCFALAYLTGAVRSWIRVDFPFEIAVVICGIVCVAVAVVWGDRIATFAGKLKDKLHQHPLPAEAISEEKTTTEAATGEPDKPDEQEIGGKA